MMSRYEVFFNDIRRVLTNQNTNHNTNHNTNQHTNQHTNHNTNHNTIQHTNKQKKRYAWYSENYFVNRGEEIKFRDMENNTKRASIITYDKLNPNHNPNNLTKYNDFILVGEVKEVESICNYNFLNNYF